MPVAKFQMPDGRVARFEVPEGTTPEQAEAMIQDEISGQAEEKPATKKSEITPEMRKQAYREAAKDMPWFQRQAAAAFTPIAGGVEAVKSWFGKGDVEEQQRIAALQEEAPVGHVAGMLSTSIIPGMGAPAAATALGRIGTAAGLGAVGGMLTPTGKQKAELSDVAGQATIGGLTGAAAGGAIEGAMAIGRGARNLLGPLTKSGAEKGAGRLASQIAGKNSDEIIQMLRAGEIDETAVQAAVKSGKAEFAALGDIVRKARMPSEYEAISKAQEAARKARIESVTPDMAEAVSSREAVAGKLYEKAMQSDVMRREMAKVSGPSGIYTKIGSLGEPITIAETMPKALDVLKSNPVIKAAEKEAKILAASMSGVSSEVAENPMKTLEGLHLMKLAIDNQFKNRTASTALQKYSDSALSLTKDRLLGAIDEVSPLYTMARQRYAEMSVPVDQAKVLQEMRSILEKPTGGERVGPFLNVLGRGEEALLKRSTGYPRYEQGDISKVLSPEQMAAVQKTSSEMLRDVEVDRLAGLGMEKTRKAIGSFEKPIPITGLLDRAVTLFNSAIRRIEGKGGEKIESTLAELMLPQNKAKLAALMEKAKPSERAALAKARAMYISGMAAGQTAGQGVSE